VRSQREPKAWEKIRTVVGASTPAGQKRPSPVAAQIEVSAPLMVS
jgi:hypothetical protein